MLTSSFSLLSGLSTVHFYKRLCCLMDSHFEFHTATGHRFLKCLLLDDNVRLLGKYVL
jgi:hypothetical protein